jgi:hypothetical protein
MEDGDESVRKRLDLAKRSELILEKALQFVTVSGHSIVTVRDIALHCGINLGLIYPGVHNLRKYGSISPERNPEHRDCVAGVPRFEAKS